MENGSIKALFIKDPDPRTIMKQVSELVELAATAEDYGVDMRLATGGKEIQNLIKISCWVNSQTDFDVLVNLGKNWSPPQHKKQEEGTTKTEQAAATGKMIGMSNGVRCFRLLNNNFHYVFQDEEGNVFGFEAKPPRGADRPCGRCAKYCAEKQVNKCHNHKITMEN